jgi:hypothetical protein
MRPDAGTMTSSDVSVPAFIAYRNDIWHMLKQQLNQAYEMHAPMSGT